MAARSIILENQVVALRQIHDVIERHDPEGAERLVASYPNRAIPNSGNDPDAVMLFLAESVAALAARLDEHIESSKPRPRGRPRKAA